MHQPHLRFAKLVGTTDENHWSQAHVFTPEKDKAETRGQLLVVISLIHPPTTRPVLEIGREILVRLNEEYYGQLDLSPQAQLQAALTKVGQEFTDDQQHLTIAAAVFWPVPHQPRTAIYLATWGRGEVWLSRTSHFGRLLAGQPQQVATLSGWVQDLDWFILGTPSLFSLVPTGVWNAAINTGLPEEAVNILAPLVHGHENGSSVAGLIAQVFFPPEVPELQVLTHSDSPVSPPSPAVNLAKAEALREGQTAPTILSPSETHSLSARFGSLKDEILSFLPRFSWPHQVYVHTQTALKSKKTALTVAILLLALLVVSIYFGGKKRQLETYRSSYLPQLEQAESSLTQGQSLATTSPDQSRELIWQARKIVSDLQSRGIKDTRLASLEGKLGQVLGAVLGEYSVTGEPWHDLSLTRPDLQIDDASQADSTVWLLQHQPVRLAKLDLSKKEVNIIAGDKQLGQAIQVAGTAQTAFVLSDKGIISFDTKEALLLKTDDLGTSSNILIANYGGNLYLLDKSAGEIWRFPATSIGKLGSKQRWLAPGIKPDLTDVKALAIDGSVWLLYNSGRLEKYLRGAPQADGLTNLDKPLNQPQDIYTDADTQFVYLLDSGNSRIVVVNKDGHYQAQYSWDRLKDAKAIFVQEAQNQIFCLIGIQIYKININH